MEQKERDIILEKIIYENFPELKKNINTKTQEIQCIPSRASVKKSRMTHFNIIIKL